MNVKNGLMVSIRFVGDKFELSFPYNEMLVAKVKELPCAKWNKANKVWEFPATVFMYLSIKKAFNVVCAEVEKLVTNKTIDISKHRFKTQPFKHQKEGVVFILKCFGFEVKE
jgi:hypothetical protein